MELRSGAKVKGPGFAVVGYFEALGDGWFDLATVRRKSEKTFQQVGGNDPLIPSCDCGRVETLWIGGDKAGHDSSHLRPFALCRFSGHGVVGWGGSGRSSGRADAGDQE